MPREMIQPLFFSWCRGVEPMDSGALLLEETEHGHSVCLRLEHRTISLRCCPSWAEGRDRAASGRCQGRSKAEPHERARKWGWGPRLQRSLTEATSPRGRIERNKTGLSAETTAVLRRSLRADNRLPVEGFALLSGYRT